jgi:putative SOS response-associated peptidase YedK
MCGRYVTVSKVKAIEKRFNVQASQPELYTPNTNVSHGQHAPVVASDKPGELQFFQFGFTPFWAKKQFYMVNARSEGDFNKEDDPQYTGSMGIVNKPMFRQSIRSKRCLVVADAFIEGPKKEKLDKPHVVYLKDGERPFALAGIWDEWVNKESGEVVHSFAIITTVSNDLMDRIGHHRSPVVLDRNQEAAWLDPNLELAEVTGMLGPYDARKMNAYPIAPTIKNPRANGISLLEPIGQRLYPEYNYELFSEIKMFGMGETAGEVQDRASC